MKFVNSGKHTILISVKMSSKQGHESLESYTDNIKVKISEKYKPPPRINAAMTYSQKLVLNKQNQDNISNYEFFLENTVLEKMKELKNMRLQASQERQSKLKQSREEMKEKINERIEQEKLEEVEVKTVVESMAVTNVNNVNTSTVSFAGGGLNTNESYSNYSTANSILQPLQVCNNYSDILKPIQLQNQGIQQYNKKDDKSPFNISDFENDTSSPFDNMELKSINDMEELAHVLNKGEKHGNHASPYPLYQNIQPPNQADISQLQSNYISYLGNQYSYNIPNSVSYTKPTTSNYSYTNGYYYSPDMVSQNQSIKIPYFSKTNIVDYSYNTQCQGSTLEMKRSSCKSVPDIVNELETELENIHISNNKPPDKSNINPQVRPKSTDPVYSILKKQREETDDIMTSLSKSQQDLCRSISSMGFPISRVARICQLIGSDQKKVSILISLH